jgi:hypothetical protein
MILSGRTSRTGSKSRRSGYGDEGLDGGADDDDDDDDDDADEEDGRDVDATPDLARAWRKRAAPAGRAKDMARFRSRRMLDWPRFFPRRKQQSRFRPARWLGTSPNRRGSRFSFWLLTVGTRLGPSLFRRRSMSPALLDLAEQHTSNSGYHSGQAVSHDNAVTFLSGLAHGAGDEPCVDDCVSHVLDNARAAARRAHDAARGSRRRSSSRPRLPCDRPVVAPESLLPVLLAEFADRDRHRGVKRARLQSEYKAVDADWRTHCARMEKIQARQLKKRQALVPIHAPAIDPNSGLPFMPNEPGTPGPSFLSSRMNRRNASNAVYGDAVRSEAEFLEILASLEHANMKDPNMRAMRTTAVVPDMVVDPSERSCILDYDDSSHLVRDPEQFFGIHNPKPDVWTQDEVQLFCSRFAQYPKQFGKIAAALPHKTTAQCVLFYYRSKKEIDFRALSDRKGKARRLKRGTKAASSSLLSNIQAVEEDADSPPPTPQPPRPPQIQPDRPSLVDSSAHRSATVTTNSTARTSLKPGPKSKRYARFASPSQPDSAGSSADAPPSEGLLAAAEALGALAGGIFSNDSNQSTPTAEEATADDHKPDRRRPRPKDGVNGDVTEASTAPHFSRRKSGSSYWTVAERNDFVRLLGVYGRDYVRIAEGLGTQTKTPVQCKNVSLDF